MPASNETVPIELAFAAAVRVDRKNGFVKRHHHYTNSDGEMIRDNYSVVKELLELPDVAFTQEELDTGHELLVYFRERVALQKLADEMSDYNKRLEKILQKEHVDSRADLGMIASLPNSRRIEDKRNQMDDLFDRLSNKSEFIGKPKMRFEVNAQVMDVKWLPKSGSYIVTTVTKDDNVAKFFVQKNTMDGAELAPAISNQTIRFIGTVREHVENEYTKCRETVFNRVKII